MYIENETSFCHRQTEILAGLRVDCCLQHGNSKTKECVTCFHKRKNALEVDASKVGVGRDGKWEGAHINDSLRAQAYFLL